MLKLNKLPNLIFYRATNKPNLFYDEADFIVCAESERLVQASCSLKDSFNSWEILQSKKSRLLDEKLDYRL